MPSIATCIAHTPPSGTAPGWTDAAGYAVFSAGRLGRLHVEAHRALDAGRLVEGHRALRDGLAGVPVACESSVHLVWHLMIFELRLGRLARARELFVDVLLPAVRRGEARVDGPAALWWLTVAGADPATLPWEAVATRARAELGGPAREHARLHDLLALAGAGQLDALDAWIDGARAGSATARQRTLLDLARGLRAFAAGNLARAAALLSKGARSVSLLGGSRAQNELFRELAELAGRRAVLGIGYPGVPWTPSRPVPTRRSTPHASPARRATGSAPARSFARPTMRAA